MSLAIVPLGAKTTHRYRCDAAATRARRDAKRVDVDCALRGDWEKLCRAKEVSNGMQFGGVDGDFRGSIELIGVGILHVSSPTELTSQLKEARMDRIPQSVCTTRIYHKLEPFRIGSVSEGKSSPRYSTSGELHSITGLRPMTAR